MKEFSDYQALVLAFSFVLNLMCSVLVVFLCYAMVRFENFRSAVAEAVQDNDKAYNWIDARNVGLFVAGYLCAWFTMNLTFIFVYAKMFEVGPIALVSLFVGVTFTLWGIAWKK